MRHNHRQPPQVAEDNIAGRTRNRIKQNRAQNPNVLDMSSQPQASKPSISTGVGHPAPSVNVLRHALAVSTRVASIASLASIVPMQENGVHHDATKGRKMITSLTIRFALLHLPEVPDWADGYKNVYHRCMARNLNLSKWRTSRVGDLLLNKIRQIDRRQWTDTTQTSKQNCPSQSGENAVQNEKHFTERK